MSTNVAVFAAANLPSTQSLAASLRSMEVATGPAGIVILKMDKTGHWVFGADQTEVEDDSVWAVNPYSFTKGVIAWGDGEVLGEKMVGIAEPMPDVGPAPAGAKKGWETQVGFSLKCMSGEDEGMEARYTATSVGGKKGVQALAVAIATQCDKDGSKPVPVIALKKEHYQHKSFGRIYTPLFAIKEWVGLGGKEEAPAEVEPEEAPAVEEAPRRRRRSSAEAA